jgi:pyridoxal phosphate enzyme (YggS family)
MGPPELEDRISLVRARITEACRRSGRSGGKVLLIAATKGVPVDAIRRAREAGIEDLAENYANELAEKALRVPARWHFIGKLQRGTAGRVAKHADVIHSAEPGEAFRRVATRAARAGKTLQCLVEVDFTGTRQGTRPEGVAGFLEEAGNLAGIRLVGLMTLPPWTPDPEGARSYFERLRNLRDALADGHPELHELSMGMSRDYEVAVEEGATMVRVGTALFGSRPESQTR